jgi:hypothetical protein
MKTNMNMINKVPFYGNEIFVIEKNRKRYVPIGPKSWR